MHPAATLSNQIVSKAIQHDATDIHLIPFEQGARIYFRINGNRSHHKQIPLHHYHLLLTHYKFTSGMDIGEIQKPQNGSLVFMIDKHRYALRLSTLPVQETESLAIRILPQDESKELEYLFLFTHQYKHIKHWTTFQSGLILMTGPTGSGKSTTLYALLRKMIVDQSKQLITLEDPIEQQIPNILQVQLNPRAGMTYLEGFKAILRHDPDVIMIGEIRDAETASFAINAALSGHVVFSTFHASNALGTITRLLDMGIDRSDLQEALRGVAAMQLVQLNTNNHLKNRAAILEILTEQHIQASIRSEPIPLYSTFDHLRRKAMAYGFI